MDWGSILFAIYLLGMLSTMGVMARPIARVMGVDTRAEHADRSQMREADVIVLATVTGIGMLWPLTLPFYVTMRFIPASTPEDDDDTELALALAQRYGQPE